MYDVSKYLEMKEGDKFRTKATCRVQIVATAKVVVWIDAFGVSVPLDVLEGAKEYRIPAEHAVSFEGAASVFIAREQPEQWVKNSGSEIYTSVDMRPQVPDAVRQIERQVKLAEIAARQRSQEIERASREQMAKWEKRFETFEKKRTAPEPALAPEPDSKSEGEE